ncbi:Mitochondrial carrier [Rhizoctonia solani]|uniref:Mitochondrial carrier n=1 Tax=Rhizoctonia solani TaxID=456999 RepID=A0A8H7M6M6_9AGAM|nr:Mitochondrial carrier [Rhizoctonia solani]
MASAGQDASIGPITDFVAGTVGGMVGLAVGFPFDTTPRDMNRYRNGVTALVKIIREERVAGLFKGISSPMAGCAFLNGLVFAGSGFFMRAQMSDPNAEPTLTQITIAGAGTGILASLIATPTELIKIRQQANTSAGAQPSAWVVAKDLWRRAYFATYEGMQRLLAPARLERKGTPVTEDGRPIFVTQPSDVEVKEAEKEMEAQRWARLMVSGGVAGIAGWIFTFHLDSIKTRVQSIDYSPPIHHPASSSAALGNFAPGAPAMALARGYSASASSPYRTTWSTAVYMYRVEGLRSFWKGLWPTIVRAVPVNMATFGAYEIVVQMMR